MIHYEEELEATIYKCWKSSYRFFFFRIHRKTLEQEFHFDEISYLKPAILLKKETPTQMFYSVIFEIFQDSYF